MTKPTEAETQEWHRIAELGKVNIAYERQIAICGKEKADNVLFFWVKGYLACQQSQPKVDLNAIHDSYKKLALKEHMDSVVFSRIWDLFRPHLHPQQPSDSEAEQAELFTVIRKVISESTSIYCHYNNIVSEKEFVSMNNLIELNNLASRAEFKNRKK